MIKRFIQLLAVALLPACDDPFEPQVHCVSWSSCPDGLAIAWEVQEGSFGRQRPDFLVPGDSILIRINAFNRSNLPLDSVWLDANAAGTSGAWIRLLNIAPGERREVTDTLVVGGYTFDRGLGLYIGAYTGPSADGALVYIDPVVTARSAFPRIARSGYAIDVVNTLGPTIPIRYRNQNANAVKIQHKTVVGILGLISNPYDLPTVPLGIGACIYDMDHCFVQFETATKTPAIPPGGSEYLELAFTLNTDGHFYYDWWSQTPFGLNVCAEHSFLGQDCDGQWILITANFEVDCVVTTIPLGVAVTDSVSECGHWKDGSAYRFEAKKGERYTVQLLAGSGIAFLSGREGVYVEDAKPTSLIIPNDGTYYVAVLHQGQVQLRLDRSN